MKKIILSLVLLSCCFFSAKSQDSINKPTVQLEGQLSLTTNGDALFVSLGGAILRMNFDKFTLAFITMPILKFKEDPMKPFITPAFGAGVQLYFLKDKRFFISAPFYYNSAISQWQFTAGVGYVFTKPRKP